VGRSVVEWEAPENGRIAEAWTEEAAELKSKPNTWGMIASYPARGKDRRGRDKGAVKASGLASSITRGVLMAFRPQGAFKGVSRLKDGEYKVYAIYLGEEEEW
jgi:hypothetical protein